jgi:transposase-like protein
MRYPAAEKLEIIRLVEQSHLPVRRTLAKLGILPARFYRWYDRYQTGGPAAPEDKVPRPKRLWNRIPDDVRDQIVQLALDEPERSPRELATRFTHDLITSPAFIVMKAADEFKDKTTAPNQLWRAAQRSGAAATDESSSGADIKACFGDQHLGVTAIVLYPGKLLIEAIDKITGPALIAVAAAPAKKSHVDALS